MTASARFTTLSEPDNARITRAFEAVRQTLAADAILEPEPDKGQIHHTVLTVVAPTGSEAVDRVSRMAAAMDKAFSREGPGILQVSVYRRARPVEDRTTQAAGYVLRIAVLVVGLLGATVLTRGVQLWQTGPDRLPPAAVWGMVVVMGLGVGVLVLPGPVFMALFFMAIPTSIAAVIVSKANQVREAARWRSTRATITKSELRAQHHRQASDVTAVKNVPDIEYEFTLGDRVIKAKRIGVGEVPDNVEAMLDHYRVGTTVPVYYDPKNPENAMLERGAPLPTQGLYAIAAGVFLVGLLVLSFFWNISSIFEALAPYFPAKAFLPGMAVFILGGVMVLAILWASRRQAAEASGWPQVAGRIVSSTVEHYRQRVGGARTGNLATFYEAVVEYAFSVNGREFHSTRLNFGAKVAGSQQLAEAQAGRYPEGSQVMVRYDPQNPANSVVETEVAHGMMMIGVALAFFAAAIFFSGVF